MEALLIKTPFQKLINRFYEIKKRTSEYYILDVNNEEYEAKRSELAIVKAMTYKAHLASCIQKDGRHKKIFVHYNASSIKEYYGENKDDLLLLEIKLPIRVPVFQSSANNVYEIDEIAKGNQSWHKVLHDAYKELESKKGEVNYTYLTTRQ